MKKTLRILLCSLAVSLLFTACQTQEDPAESSEPSSSEEEVILPDPTKPDGAMVELLEGAKQWDTELFSGYLPNGVSVEEYIPEALRGTLQDALKRMDYHILRTETNGQTAYVELEITAINAESAAGEAISAAAAYVVQQQLSDASVQDIQEIAGVIADAIDVDSLPMQTTTCTAYLVQQQDGTWQLDTQDERNLSLLNAASGGSLSLVDDIKALAEQYGITIQ